MSDINYVANTVEEIDSLVKITMGLIIFLLLTQLMFFTYERHHYNQVLSRFDRADRGIINGNYQSFPNAV